MSKYDALSPITGKYENLVWRHHPASKKTETYKKWWILYLGDVQLGYAHDTGYGGWWACSTLRASDLKGLRSIYGLKTRRDAMNYLLRVAGIWA